MFWPEVKRIFIISISLFKTSILNGSKVIIIRFEYVANQIFG